MKSLIEILDGMNMFGGTDMAAIRTYLSQPEVLPDAVAMLTGFLEAQVKRLEQYKAKQQMWAFMVHDYYFKDFPHDVATKFAVLSRENIAEIPLEGENLEWAKENVPKYKIKEAFWNPLLEDFHRHGIYFKNEDPNDP